MTTVLHVSDLHFGHPAVPEQFEAIEELIAAGRYDVVAISGDVSQRARAGEFQRARKFIRDAQKVSRTIVVPGNHDVQWWRAPLGVGDDDAIYAAYREYVDPETEPVLAVRGATFVGLCTPHGITRRTLTWNVRDLSVIGDLTGTQLERARALMARVPDGDARVIVMHHNPVKGELSQRHGLKDTRKILGAFAAMGVDLVLCGHDHQEAVHYIEHTKKGTVISTAGTVSNRSRGGRPSSLNVITIGARDVRVATHIWGAGQRAFVAGEERCFAR